MDTEFGNRLLARIPEERVKRKEPMSRHTTFRIGGPADYFAAPESPEELSALLALCRGEGVPWYIIGNGSNLLVGDKGYRGVIIQIGSNMSRIRIEEDPEADGYGRITAQAGISLSVLAAEAARAGLAGLEFASGIPGALGGAAAMNAGAYGGEIWDLMVSARVITREGKLLELSREQAGAGYRTSRIQQEGLIAVEAVFRLVKGLQEEIEARMRHLNRLRREKQPLSYPSAGSTFKRPEGYYAGKLIMEAGLAGYRVGDMAVSEKHCGFVINTGHGTAAQAARLIEDVKRIVFEKSGVLLEPEVRFLGEF